MQPIPGEFALSVVQVNDCFSGGNSRTPHTSPWRAGLVGIPHLDHAWNCCSLRFVASAPARVTAADDAFAVGTDGYTGHRASVSREGENFNALVRILYLHLPRNTPSRRTTAAAAFAIVRR